MDFHHHDEWKLQERFSCNLNSISPTSMKLDRFGSTDIPKTNWHIDFKEISKVSEHPGFKSVIGFFFSTSTVSFETMNLTKEIK